MSRAFVKDQDDLPEDVADRPISPNPNFVTGRGLRLIDEMLETAKSVDAILLTLNEKCRKDVIDRIPDNIKCISTYSIGFDHIDLEACKAADGVLLGAIGGPKWDNPNAKTRPLAAAIQ